MQFGTHIVLQLAQIYALPYHQLLNNIPEDWSKKDRFCIKKHFLNLSGCGYSQPLFPLRRHLFWQRDKFCLLRNLSKPSLSPIEFGLLNALAPARNKIPPLMPLPHRFTANHNTASRARCRNVYFNA